MREERNGKVNVETDERASRVGRSQYCWELWITSRI